MHLGLLLLWPYAQPRARGPGDYCTVTNKRYANIEGTLPYTHQITLGVGGGRWALEMA